MSRGPVILLPPSQGKRPGGRRGGRDEFVAVLGPARARVRTAVPEAAPDAEGFARILGARGATLERYRDGDLDGPTAPAWWRYDGVVWQHLEPETLTDEQRGRVLVPSALYGVTTARDRLVDYRLTFDATVVGPGRLDAFWRPILGDLIREWSGGRPIVDLLPSEHRRALGALEGLPSLVPVDFVAADGRRAAGHAAKAVKGALARTILLWGLDAVPGFHWRGWRATYRESGVLVRAPGASAGAP